MARRPFTVLVATDGSPQARAAVAATVSFPWPDGACAHAAGADSWPQRQSSVTIAVHRVLHVIMRVIAALHPP